MKVQNERVVSVFLILFYSIIIFDYFFKLYLEYINLIHTQKREVVIPEEMKHEFEQSFVNKSKEYTTEKQKLQIINVSTSFLLILILLLYGFPYFESISTKLFDNTILSGLYFAFLIWIIFRFVDFWFSLYRTFAVEKKYGFSNISFALFMIDQLKVTALSIILGSAILYGLIWTIYNIEQWWIIFIAGFIVINLFINWIYPAIVVPIFNKLKPLEDPELKEKINKIADYAGFKTKGIFVLDASRRTRHSNAMFSGIGNTKRIILYDTLLENNAHEEIEAIFAHEAGHYVNKDILKSIFLSIAIFIISVTLLWCLISNDVIKSVFKVNAYYSELVYGFVFVASIISLIRGLINGFSRKREYEADLYAAKYLTNTKIVIEALKKLYKSNLSNLNPHPLYVKFNYSHPTLLERIKRLKKSCSSIKEDYN
ncbi:MAG: M48 family metallopeptidase [Asgard group archaeon]|nr:M48 family metallopeptidase [Asgard group archaeon]